jgi:RHS repeat-associated protein
MTYPAEYNSYALGGAPITWRTDSAGNWRKEYKLFDHLGSVRTVLREKPEDPLQPYEYREQISYKPFGEVKDRLYCTGSADADARLKYIGKQYDSEMGLADHGVRKYDNSLGMFTSIDPLWEKYYGWTPYNYTGNNPMMAVDNDGKEWEFTGTEKEKNQNKEYYDGIRVSSPFFNGLWTCLEKMDFKITISAGETTSGETDDKGKPTVFVNYGEARFIINPNVETTPEEQLETGKTKKIVLLSANIVLDQKDIKKGKREKKTPLHELGHVLHALLKTDEYYKASEKERERYANDFMNSILKTCTKSKK